MERETVTSRAEVHHQKISKLLEADDVESDLKDDVGTVVEAEEDSSEEESA